MKMNKRVLGLLIVSLVVIVLISLGVVSGAVFEDSFTNGVIDSNNWIVQKWQATSSNDNGKLKIFSDPPGTSGTNPDAKGWFYIKNKKLLQGDFDISLNFSDLQRGDNTNGEVSLFIQFDSSYWVWIMRSKDCNLKDSPTTNDPVMESCPAGTCCLSDNLIILTKDGPGLRNEQWFEINNQLSGTFRIVRQGNTIRYYFNDVLKYQKDYYGLISNKAWFWIRAGAHVNSLSVKINNFKINSGTLVDDDCPSGMISYWKFDEKHIMVNFIEGGFIDTYGSNLGLIWNQPTLANGIFGSAVNFDGVNDYVEVADNANLKPINEITLEAWVDLYSFPTTYAFSDIIDKADPGQGYYLVFDRSNRLVFKIVTDGTNGLGWVTPDYTSYIGGFHHLVGTYDGSKLRLYIDGIEVSSIDKTGNIVHTTDSLTMGAINEPASRQDFFNGTIDEVAIYNRALSAPEISSHYNNGIGRDYCAATTCPESQIIMKLFSPSNSHGALWNAAGGESYSYQDNFDGTSLSNNWIVQKNDANGYSVADGKLKMDLLGTPNFTFIILDSKQKLYGDFDVEMPFSNYQRYGGIDANGGICLRINFSDGFGVWWCRARDCNFNTGSGCPDYIIAAYTGATELLPLGTRNQAWHELNTDSAGVFKIKREGNTIIFYYNNTEKFRKTFTSLPDTATPEIYMSTIYSGENVKADVDYFKIISSSPSYNVSICYSDIFGTQGNENHNGNTILWLSDSSNAHASTTQSATYNTPVKYGDLTCQKINSGACSSLGADYKCVVTLYNDTNSHLAACDSSVPYDKKICCRAGVEITGAYWANMNDVSINTADLNDKVKLNLAGAGLTGEINYTIYKKCSGVECVWTFFFGEKKVSQTLSKGFTTWRANTTGEYYFEAKLIATSEIKISGTLTVSNTESNSPPSVTINTPAVGNIYYIGEQISFTANIEDEDDDVDAIWDFGDGLDEEINNCLTNNTCDTTHSYTTAGQKTINLYVEDQRGKHDNDRTSVLIISPTINAKYVFAHIDKPEWGENFFGYLVPFIASSSYAVQTSGCSGISCTITCLAGGCKDTIHDGGHSIQTGQTGVYTNLNFNWTFDNGNSGRYKSGGNSGKSFTFMLGNVGAHNADLEVSLL